jgi:hypothetical protein
MWRLLQHGEAVIVMLFVLLIFDTNKEPYCMNCFFVRLKLPAVVSTRSIDKLISIFILWRLLCSFGR